jgi:Mg-chelatase subunit ChlD
VFWLGGGSCADHFVCCCISGIYLIRTPGLFGGGCDLGITGRNISKITGQQSAPHIFFVCLPGLVFGGFDLHNIPRLHTEIMADNSNFLCPITGVLMSDPVIDKDGNTFERAAIEEWLAKHGTSPITRNPMTRTDLTPNRVLRSAIEDYRRNLAMTNKNKNHYSSSNESKNNGSVEETKNVEAVSPARSEPAAISDAPPDVMCTFSVQKTVSGPARDEYQCLVRVETRDVARSHVPSDIVLVIDVSGSMGNEAKTRSVETSGLSLLDVVKHGVRTIIKTLGPQDRLAVVSFSNRAQVIFNLTGMDDFGKAEAADKLDLLLPEGMTNLWDGLVTALDLLKNRTTPVEAGSSSTSPGNRSSAGRNAAVLLLTDGEPNIEPPRGHLPMLRKYRDSNNGNYPGVVSTFGFGYSLDSKLLVDIAKEAGGMYSFIPDSGFVGTAFVNALANILATVGSDLHLSVEPEGAVE